MASDTVKRVQEKLFGRGNNDPESTQDRDPGLTINIPKPAKSQLPPPKISKAVPSPKNPDEEEVRSYRDRLAEKLGAEYKGAERYRLLQDGNKERHWKRWGPYLSDRQWVSASASTFSPPTQSPHRPPFVRIIQATAMLGVTFHTNTLGLGRIDGARMVLQESQTTINDSASDFPFGTKRIPSSKNACLASQVIRATTARMSRSSIIISIRPRRIHT
jgi:hypothetical protein